MKKDRKAIMPEQYKVLAEKIINTIFAEFSNKEPTVEEWGVIIGAVQCVHETLGSVAQKRGLKWEVHRMSETKQ